MQKCFFIFTTLLVVFTTTQSAQAKSNFNYEKSLRIDFVLSGNHSHQQATIANLYKVPIYSNGKKQNIPPFDYGNYRVLVLSKSSSDTLFIKGFCTLFEEWQTTEEAKNVNRAFKQTIETPFPQKPVNLLIERRKKSGGFTTLINETFYPEKSTFTTIVPTKHPYKIIHGIDTPKNQTDILFIAEGYTAGEAEEFYTDAEDMTEYLFSMSPYNHLKEKITIRALAVPSKESGSDDPNKKIWKNTALNSTFNTFGTDRYLESFYTWTIYNHAAALPHDHIVILVNTKKYGGGGVYNHFSITSTKNNYSKKVFVHELGHGLAGLGDEYFSSEVAFSDFFDPKTEPWHPNLTTLIDFDSKWKHLIPESVPIPTPPDLKFKNKTGVFEGGGYSAKGIYRPAVNCRMKSNEAEGFCEVCRKSIKRVINFHTR